MTQDQTAQEQAAPRVVAGRYTILGEIGRGGMGVVWLAEDGMIGRRVAIKELRLPPGIDEGERHVYEQRVLREARSAGRLNDPSVVVVHDVVPEDGTTYLVMELIEAKTLAELVRERGPMDPDQVVKLAEQLLSALDTAHRAGIVHRDVKPGNVLVQANGRVKLTDFGIAQATDDPRLTTSGMLIGSPTYMSPERLRGEEATSASDLWSLGATLFFAVEGYDAYERPSAPATINAIMHEVVYLNRCHGPLASVIMGLLSPTPRGRLTADQVRGLLARTARLDDHTVPVRATPGGGTRLVGLAGKGAGNGIGRRTLALLVVVLLVAGLAGGWFARSWLAGTEYDLPDNMEPTMTYGDGGDIPEFSADQYKPCLVGKLEPGRRFPQSASTGCDELHDIEVIEWRSTMSTTEPAQKQPQKISYPAHGVMRAYAEGGCSLAFASEWVNLPDKEKELRYRAIIPAERHWDQRQEKGAGDGSNDPYTRPYYCVVWRADGMQMSKSVKVDTEN